MTLSRLTYATAYVLPSLHCVNKHLNAGDQETAKMSAFIKICWWAAPGHAHVMWSVIVDVVFAWSTHKDQIINLFILHITVNLMLVQTRWDTGHLHF